MYNEFNRWKLAISKGQWQEAADALKSQNGTKIRRTKWVHLDRPVRLNYEKFVPSQWLRMYRIDPSGKPFYDRRGLMELPIKTVGRQYSGWYLGRFPMKPTYRPQQFWGYRKEHLEYCIQTFAQTDARSMHSYVASGSWESNYHSMQSMITKRPSKITWGKAYKAWTKRLWEFGILNCAKPVKGQMEDSIVKVAASPGLDGTYLFKNKGNYFSTSNYIATSMWDTIHSTLTQDFGLYEVGGREKRQSSMEFGDLIATRMVLMQDAVSSSFGKCYADRIDYRLKRYEDGPIYLGVRSTDFEWMRVASDFMLGEWIIEGDVVEFDNSVSREWIIFGFSVMRTYFPSDDVEIDNAIAFIMSGYIYKHIVTPDRSLYRVDRGIPSGHALTSVLNSIINYCALAYAIEFSPFFKHLTSTHIRVSGDDFVIMCVGDKSKFDLASFEIWYYEHCGFKLKDLSFKLPCSEIPSERATILKLSFKPDTNFGVLPSTYPSAVIKRTLLPNSPYKISSEYVKMLSSQVSMPNVDASTTSHLSIVTTCSSGNYGSVTSSDFWKDYYTDGFKSSMKKIYIGGRKVANINPPYDRKSTRKRVVPSDSKIDLFQPPNLAYAQYYIDNFRPNVKLKFLGSYNADYEQFVNSSVVGYNTWFNTLDDLLLNNDLYFKFFLNVSPRNNLAILRSIVPP